MTTVEAYLGLGSNLRDRARNLRRAVSLLGRRMSTAALSSVYETRPWGHADQPSFLNMVYRVDTGMAPQDLLRAAQEVEHVLGRAPTFRYGPRLIDVDILLYGDRVIDTQDLRVPHPRLSERAFALVPLAEIAPELMHPELGVSVRELLKRLPAAELEGVASVGPLFGR